MRRRVEPETLYISMALKRSGVDPSVAQALYWLIHQVPGVGFISVEGTPLMGPPHCSLQSLAVRTPRCSRDPLIPMLCLFEEESLFCLLIWNLSALCLTIRTSALCFTQAKECKDKPYDRETVLRNVTEARKRGRTGQPEEDQDVKRKKNNEDCSERHAKRGGGTDGGTSGFPQTKSKSIRGGDLELTEALGEGASGIVYQGK